MYIYSEVKNNIAISNAIGQKKKKKLFAELNVSLDNCRQFIFLGKKVNFRFV